MENLVSDQQNALLRGMKIIDPSLIVNELLKWRMKKREPRIFYVNLMWRAGEDMTMLVFSFYSTFCSEWVSEKNGLKMG